MCNTMVMVVAHISLLLSGSWRSQVKQKALLETHRFVSGNSALLQICVLSQGVKDMVCMVSAWWISVKHFSVCLLVIVSIMPV